jgi:hypothetical protein
MKHFHFSFWQIDKMALKYYNKMEMELLIIGVNLFQFYFPPLPCCSIVVHCRVARSKIKKNEISHQWFQKSQEKRENGQIFKENISKNMYFCLVQIMTQRSQNLSTVSNT